MTRRSPAVVALDHHSRICGHCLATARAGRPFTEFCPRGVTLALCALAQLGIKRRRPS